MDHYIEKPSDRIAQLLCGPVGQPRNKDYVYPGLQKIEPKAPEDADIEKGSSEVFESAFSAEGAEGLSEGVSAIAEGVIGGAMEGLEDLGGAAMEVAGIALEFIAA